MSRYLGRKTNNEAEYWALLFGLQEARRLGGRSIRIFTDSELVERQVKGLYRVKNLNLKVLHTSVIQHLKAFSSYAIESIPEGGESRGRPVGQSSHSERDRKEEERKEGSKRNRWSLLMSTLVSDHEERKVRAPQGRVVRNPDCPRLWKGRSTCSTAGIRKVPQKRDRLPRFAGREELRVKSDEFYFLLRTIDSQLQGIRLGG